ncbi:sulfurtransferase-like selenium metabolism protein YedF [Clostridium sp.]|uniref:sulfurtransferase-like selenium metabolism protein YedF n=1 Tax=Clostridium sp. TaxID=1506 RepID=UPI002FC933E0
MNNIINCKGMNCPLPVVNTKKYFDTISSGTSTTIVDNEVAKNNVIKFVENSGFKYEVEEHDDLYYITVVKGDGAIENKNAINLAPQNNKDVLTIVIGSDKLGNGNDELGLALMKSYLFALSEADIIPKHLIFLNSGVKLVVEDSLVLDSLEKLKDRGVNLQSCGLCLDFYKIKDSVRIGEITNMYAIIELMNSSRTIKL